MVVSVELKHVFKYPLQFVVNTHLNKYPNEKDGLVHRVETIERKIDWIKGIDYRRRLAFCENVVPHVLRKMKILNEEQVVLEEQAWLDLDSGQMDIKSRNVTWSKYADMFEESRFAKAVDNPHWTQFEQHGYINIRFLGPLGKVLEMFAGKFLHVGAQKALRVMEELLHERCSRSET
ncbi:PRELI domain-containing protein 2 [Aplysia californica]|uniref:PRELI domain-containing protein 2 n=1 Tax=Aplysia californica TaxID=6500 RepID=A0ABM0JUL7_APLCA|nr:PRELI domain-containing protein 2 [Aplysia californica]